jgi:hypothetical protein
MPPPEIVNRALQTAMVLGHGHEARVLRSPDIPSICIRIPHESARLQTRPLDVQSILSFRPPSPLTNANGDALFIEPFADVIDPSSGAVFQLLPRVLGTPIARSFTDRAGTHYLGALFHKRLERARQKNPDLRPEELADAVCLKPGESYQWGKVASTPAVELGYYHQFLRFQHAYPLMMSALARLPQSAYTLAVDSIKRCQKSGVTLDFFHGNNTMLANGETGKELVFIDTMKPGERPVHDACSTPMGMFYALTENYDPPTAARTPNHLAKQLVDAKARQATQGQLGTIQEKILDGIRDVYSPQAAADARQDYARGQFYGRTPDGGRERLKGASRRVFPKGGLQPLPWHRQVHYVAGRVLGKGWLWGKGKTKSTAVAAVAAAPVQSATRPLKKAA